uniref:WD repeat-containing protein 36 n=1 Tax=Aceria tosichella TaxID=561515 RepID=A0A6G1S835_9ACAR
MEQPSSNLFEGYKSLGHVTGPLPFIVRHGKNSQASRIITIVGRTFHTYTTNLQLIEVSIPHEKDIRMIISDERYIYTASGRSIFQWGRGSKKLVNKFDNGHQSDVKMMIKFGPTCLLSLDDDNNLFNWNTLDKGILNIIPIDDALFQVTAMCQPLGYRDKCLFGSKQGQLELWNVVSEKCLYKFSGWDSKVTSLVQSPIENVVAIGLEDGHVYVQNIKYDETVMKIYQEYGAITSMSFRLDGRPFLVTASPVGHLMIWNLERKRLATQIRHAHANSISNCQFLRNESQLVTTGTDNTIKVWTLDMSDGGGQLLCQRAGHSEPPSHIRFYGPKGLNILSAGLDSTIKMFHVYSERFNRNLGTARMNPKSKNGKSKSSSSNINKLPPISCFAAECCKEKQWDNIAACHKGSSLVTTWNYDKCCMGEHIIMQPTFSKHDVLGSSICITGCGNFVVIGFSNGLIFKYNIQSGMFKQYYENPKLTDHRAHDGQVTGVTVDALDMVLISSGSDSRLRLWNFKTSAMMKDFEMSAPIDKIELHRQNNLIAVAMENMTIEILDFETQVLVRKFQTTGKILDMCYSPDSHWLIVALDDKSIRTWDLNLGKMIDAFSLSSVCTSLSMSATGEFLATAHEDSLGVNIWGNYTLYCPTRLKPIDPTLTPPLLDMPFVRDDELFQDDDEQELPNEDIQLAPVSSDHSADPSEYVSPEQLNEQLITLSGLPSSRWKNLLKIEEMREKQLIEEEERKERQIKVPFFIPVKDGLKPKLDSEQVQPTRSSDETSSAMNSVSKINELRLLSPLAQCLIDCARRDGDYNEFFKQLKELGPSATDAEVRSLGKDTCGTIEPMLCFLDAIEKNNKTNTDYELTSAWLALFLKAHSDIIQTDPSLRTRCESLLPIVGASWDKLNEKFNQILCVLNFVRSSIL